MKRSPCQRIKDEEKETETVHLAKHRSDPNDLITAFIKQGEAGWGKAEDDVDDDNDDLSSSGPSQYWGEAPKKTTAETSSPTHFYKLDDSASECESSQSRQPECPTPSGPGPPSKQVAGFPDVPIEIWGG